MEYIGYLASIIIGISLGLIGSGGSILTVPVLVYLFSVDAVAATAYSLFIVGITSIAGSINYLVRKQVDHKAVLFFGIPSVISVYLSRAFVVPAIPDEMQLGGYSLSKGTFLLMLFAIMMILSSYSMISKTLKIRSAKKNSIGTFLMISEGLVVGVITGIVGAGGGFLIIPSLVMLSGLQMKEAIGTSLVIIAVKSLIGFTGESSETVIDYPFLTLVSLFAVAGVFIGMMVSSRIDGNKLKPLFGWFVLAMGIYMIIKETFFT